MQRRLIFVDMDGVQMAGDAYILTQPTPQPSCAAGKVEWIERKLLTRKFLLAPHKAVCARPDALLIDDCEANCREWRARGGVAWTFPRPWNNSNLHVMDIIGALRSLVRFPNMCPINDQTPAAAAGVVESKG